MKRILTATLLLLLIAGTALAASGEAPADWQEATPEGMAEASLELLLKGDYVNMAEKVFESGDPKFFGEEKLRLVKRQFVAQLPMFENYLRYELAEKEDYGQSLVKLIYVVVSEDIPLIFTFHYFKAKETWEIINFNFSAPPEGLP